MRGLNPARGAGSARPPYLYWHSRHALVECRWYGARNPATGDSIATAQIAQRAIFNGQPPRLVKARSRAIREPLKRRFIFFGSTFPAKSTFKKRVQQTKYKICTLTGCWKWLLYRGRVAQPGPPAEGRGERCCCGLEAGVNTTVLHITIMAKQSKRMLYVGTFGVMRRAARMHSPL